MLAPGCQGNNLPLCPNSDRERTRERAEDESASQSLHTSKHPLVTVVTFTIN